MLRLIKQVEFRPQILMCVPWNERCPEENKFLSGEKPCGKICPGTDYIRLCNKPTVIIVAGSKKQKHLFHFLGLRRRQHPGFRPEFYLASVPVISAGGFPFMKFCETAAKAKWKKPVPESGRRRQNRNDINGDRFSTIFVAIPEAWCGTVRRMSHS